MTGYTTGASTGAMSASSTGTQTVTALFDRYDDAAEAVARIKALGIPASDISIVSNDEGARTRYAGTNYSHDHSDVDHVSGTGTGATTGTAIGGGVGLLAGLGLLAIPGLGPVVAAGWLASTLVGAGVGALAGGLIGSLTDAGVDESDAHAYAEGVKRGGTLVTVRASADMAARVADVLDDEGTVDMDERETNWRSEGWAPGTTGTGTTGTGIGGAIAGAAAGVASAARGAADAVTGGSMTDRDDYRTGTTGMGATARVHGTDETLKVVEERLAVGKREVNRGRVRISSRVVETPVTEQVRLHDERVVVDRRPVDRPVTGSFDEMARAGTRTIEATESVEVPVVSKEARVVEEIGLRKEVTDRVETVSDTVRSTKVEVEDARTETEIARDRKMGA